MEVPLSRRIRARINIGQRGEVFVGAERNPLLLPTLSGHHHHHHHHYLLSQSREMENGGGRIMLAEDEEVKRIGREALAEGRKDAPPHSKTRRRRPRCAPRRKEVKQWRVREEMERSKKTRIPFEQLTGLVLPLSLFAGGFTDYAPVDRARSSARLRAAERRERKRRLSATRES